VSEQRRRLERALRGCAEGWTPRTADPWPAIRERVSGTAAGRGAGEGGARAREDRAADGARRRPPLVPNRPLGWALAVLSVLIVGAGVYGASGPLREVFRDGLPGSVGAGSGEGAARVPSTQPDANLAALRTELDRTKTQDGTKVTLDWAYADERYVAVGLHTQNLDGSDVVLQPSLWDDTVGNEAELPPYLKITNASGQDFDSVGGGTLLGPDRTGADATFDAPEGIETGREHRFRLEVPLMEEPRVGVKASGKPKPGPFVFDFEIPVRPAPTIELNQRAEAEGVAMTLRRVVASPVVPQAVVCFEAPDNGHRWTPWFEDDGSYPKVTSNPQKLGDGCWSLTMDRAVEGHTSVTVDHLEGFPASGNGTTVQPKTIHGPWTFEFEAPAP
jgi:hypothetical protein